MRTQKTTAIPTYQGRPARPRPYAKAEQLMRLIRALARQEDQDIAYDILIKVMRYTGLTNRDALLCVFQAGKRREALKHANRPLERACVNAEGDADLRYALTKYLNVDTKVDCINGVELDIIFIDEANMPEVKK